MGRKMKWGGGAVRCEVCPDVITHENSEVVGRKLSGSARCVHRRARCQQKWAAQKDAIMATWVENRPTTNPEPAAVPAPSPKEEPAVATPTPPTPVSPKPRVFYKPKAELVTLLIQLLQKDPYYKGWSQYYYRFISGSQPDLLLDAYTGVMPGADHFWTVVKRTNERLSILAEAQRTMGVDLSRVYAPERGPAPTATAPPLKLVPAENPKELRAKLDDSERARTRAEALVVHAAAVLTHVHRLLLAGEGDTLAAVADMLERP